MSVRKLVSLFDDMEKLPTSNSESLQEVNLSKTLTNKIIETLKKYGDKDYPKVLRDIIESIKIPNYDFYKMAEINQTTPKILESLFADRYTSADFEDIKVVLESICTHIVEKTDFKDFIFSIGMGGSVDIPNIRMPSCILPAIKNLDKVHVLSETGEINGCPRVKVFKANHMAILVNGFDTDRVLKISELSFEFLRKFIERFYPHLQDFVVFTEDKEITQSEKDYFNGQAELLKTIESIGDDVQNVIRMGGKHSQLLEENYNDSLLYAVAHPYYNQSIINPAIDPLKEAFENPSVIIDYGGRPQMRFNKISRGLMNLTKSHDRDSIITPIIHIITKAGKIPVYYAARDGDIPLGKNISSIDYDKIDRATHVDYKEIFSSVKEQEFIDFVNEFNQTHSSLIDSLQ